MYFLQLTDNRKGTLSPPPLKTPLLGPGRDLSSKNDLVEHCIASLAHFPTPLKVSLSRLVPVIPKQLLNFTPFVSWVRNHVPLKQTILI